MNANNGNQMCFCPQKVTNQQQCNENLAIMRQGKNVNNIHNSR